MTKIMIHPVSSDASKPWAHLEPIVDTLITNGNSALSSDIFSFDKDGWYCLLKNPIDFDLLESSFEFPKNIQLSREDCSILDTRTWIEIRGGHGMP